MSLLIALALQAAVATAPASPPTDEASATATVSGVVVPSPKAKEPPKVYAPTYKAAPHLGSGAPQISAPSTIDQFFKDESTGSRMRSQSMSALVVSQYAAQRHRAKKAADLINAGRCPEALQGVFNEGDAQLTIRVAEVCGLPSPMERRHGPPF